MKTYYLIDFENLHEDALKITKKANKEDSLIIFYTSNSPKISLDAFEGQKTKNEVIKIKAGKNISQDCTKYAANSSGATEIVASGKMKLVGATIDLNP